MRWNRAAANKLTAADDTAAQTSGYDFGSHDPSLPRPPPRVAVITVALMSAPQSLLSSAVDLAYEAAMAPMVVPASGRGSHNSLACDGYRVPAQLSAGHLLGKPKLTLGRNRSTGRPS